MATFHGEEVSWERLREIVWERDGGICNVCTYRITRKEYHLGHIVDRVAGGDDSDENAAVMCALCNMMKPVHNTREEYDAWLKRGGWINDMIVELGVDVEGPLSIYTGRPIG